MEAIHGTWHYSYRNKDVHMQRCTEYAGIISGILGISNAKYKE